MFSLFSVYSPVTPPALVWDSLSYLVTVKRLLAALSADSLHVIHLHFKVYFGVFVVRESELNITAAYI